MILLDHTVTHSVLYQWEFWTAVITLFITIAGSFLALRDQVRDSKLRIAFLEESQAKEEDSRDEYQRMISKKLTDIWKKVQQIEVEVAKKK